MVAIDPPVVMADAAVFHARLRNGSLRFGYRVLALFVDIDRLDEPSGCRLLSIGRFNLLGFHAADHGPRDGSSLRSYIDGLHRDAQLQRPDRVVLVCFPRILGFVFNPISTYACMDASGRTVSVVYEVRNTFGEHHTYLMPAHEDGEGVIAPHECDKLFYVSPFMDMPMRYRFLLSAPRGGDFSLKIIERDQAGVLLTALMRATAFPATVPAVLGRLARTPLLGLKVLAAIHWQALRLWLKGHHVRPRPKPPSLVSREVSGEFSLLSRQASSGAHNG